ncbi:MAG: peptidoglycan editing factor PgeF [Nitrospiraceae bacterium]|nr:MAG: peptidoglycan editing factor PgeF [Nitrospiraceae bacterium]
MLIQPDNTAFSYVRAFFSTRSILKNNDNIRDVLAGELNIAINEIYLPIQKHTNNVHILDTDHIPVIADAVITKKRHILIGVMVADCVPILLYDNVRGVIGAVHAGWRGTAKQILMETLSSMQNRFGSVSEDIAVAIGPSIRQCSYEVDEDVRNAVMEATGEGNYYSVKGNKYFIDLSDANRIQALIMGILPQNIWQSEECTFCNPDRYYSYRYSGGSAGRQGGFIGMW